MRMAGAAADDDVEEGVVGAGDRPVERNDARVSFFCLAADTAAAVAVAVVGTSGINLTGVALAGGCLLCSNSDTLVCSVGSLAAADLLHQHETACKHRKQAFHTDTVADTFLKDLLLLTRGETNIPNGSLLLR